MPERTATNRQLWRLNELGLVRISDEGEPITHEAAGEVLAAALPPADDEQQAHEA